MFKLLWMEPWPRSHVRPPGPMFPLEFMSLVPRITPWWFIWTLMFLLWQPEMYEWRGLRSWSYTLTSGVPSPLLSKGQKLRSAGEVKWNLWLQTIPLAPHTKGWSFLREEWGDCQPPILCSQVLWTGRNIPGLGTSGPPPQQEKDKWRSAWGLEKRDLLEASAGDLRCSRGLTPCARARILQKNRTSRRYRLGVGGLGRLWRERETATFKELAYKLMEVGKSEIFRVGREAGDPGKTWCCSSQTIWKQDSFLFGTSQSVS